MAVSLIKSYGRSVEGSAFLFFLKCAHQDFCEVNKSIRRSSEQCKNVEVKFARRGGKFVAGQNIHPLESGKVFSKKEKESIERHYFYESRLNIKISFLVFPFIVVFIIGDILFIDDH